MLRLESMETGAHPRHVLVLVHRQVGDPRREGSEQPDASLHRAVATALGADAFDVVPATTARGGLNACVALEPACVVIELELGSPDGLWLASAIRGQTARVASVPIILLAGRATSSSEADVQVTALARGVDVIITKPFEVVELVAQIRALVEMATRVSARARKSLVPPADLPRGTRRPKGAMAGDLSRMSAPSVLTALELEARSGELRLADPDGMVPLRLFLATGALIGGQLGTAWLTPLEAMVEATRWRGRTFEFLPGRAVPAPPGAAPIGKLTLLAIQQADSEVAAAAEPLRPTVPTPPPRPLPADVERPRRRVSGTRRKVLTPLVQPGLTAPPPAGPGGWTHAASEASPAGGPGHGTARTRPLLESLAGNERRLDPRAEPEDDDESTARRETA